MTRRARVVLALYFILPLAALAIGIVLGRWLAMR
jgi:hypothetical protein